MKNLKIPQLKKGSLISIVAPAGAVNKEQLMIGLDFLKQNNIDYYFGRNTFKNYYLGYNYSAKDKHRKSDLQEALNNPKVDAIWCARGGYGCVKIVDELDFTKFKKNPKWLIGYSDITVLHNKINALGYPSIHGAGVKPYSNKQPVKVLNGIKKILFKHKLSYELKLPSKNPNNIKGKLVGGNLSIIYSQLGSLEKDFFDDKILFIEDLMENYYHVDRMLMALKRMGVLNKIKALILGSFNFMGENIDSNKFYKHEYNPMVYKIIDKFTKDLQIPIIYNFPAGHLNNNNPLIMGADLKIKFKKEYVKLTW